MKEFEAECISYNKLLEQLTSKPTDLKFDKQKANVKLEELQVCLFLLFPITLCFQNIVFSISLKDF